MKTLSPAFQAHLDGELTTLAELVKITRTDGAVKAFTTHDADLTVDGVIYNADGSFSPGVLENAASLKENSFEISGILDSEIISEADLKAGLYDNARIDIFIVNWADVTQGAVQMRRGWLGEVTLAGGKFVAELRGLHDLLQRRVGDVYTPECRYDLGDARCMADSEALKVTGAVTGVINDSAFVDYMRGEADGTFNYGKLVWTSGANQGVGMEVRNWDALNQTFSLWLPMPNPISVNDAYEVYPGCDKRFSTCKAKFNNAVNFGGFPHLPGLDKILQYPDSR
ncbi:MAG: DUF2163 domain-containing protein [Alphaproteobacteria bacterium]|nr:DUF2163 domain-containing protein [Alphaproteobacteria bacterium]